MEVRHTVIAAFRQQFGADPSFLVRAPGRVNLLGEHLDYNDGFVLPVAIDRATILACRPSGSSHSTLLALDMHDRTTFDKASIVNRNTSGDQPLPVWAYYPAGMQWCLDRQGLATPGMDAVFASDVPIGSGLSSSASIEMAFGLAWQRLGGWTLPPMEMAKVGQQTENLYVGVNCGVMDEFASICGIKDHLLLLDCRSLEWRALPLPGDIAIIIADTKVPRALATSTYNDLRVACEEAVRILQSFLPGIHSLRDVSPEQFNSVANRLPNLERKRARHVVEEIERTRQAVLTLQENDIAGFGRLMNQCHISLRDLYEVSCTELDIMVEAAWSLPGCYGARLTGAGFGGCTVNLVAQEQALAFSRDLAAIYQKKTGIKPDVYICQASAGASILSV